ncbi:glycosyltransferase family 39 protein [Pollutimonas sp. H1-120]|uniref:ArnT family glycosyltransferase n=1 Tax=Pollutimonas sp. H1-120 TaxID=3148824 RepID=UPI003B520F12
MQRFSKGAWLTLAAVLLLLPISMMIIPLYDTSEPRYAEIARIMAQSGDWITPWFSPGVPFWGKPPLSFWAQALSMKAFGVTEFAARFPSWLCLLLSNGILLAGLRSLRGPRVALWAAIIYSTCTLVYISSGAVLTDPFLALGTTLSMVSFAMAVQHRHPALIQAGDQQRKSTSTQNESSSCWWQYGFFLGLAIGLLAKGPLAVVLSFVPVVVWYALNRKSIEITKALPWGKGLALIAALSLPWYILAEIKTPGFLDYFIVGEHFRRFLDPGWEGDLYGTAHRQMYGTIWLYWLQASFPWGVLMLAAMIGALRSSRLRVAMKATSDDPLCSYWLASALFTPLFFTFSANILWTYILPSLAAFSVLMAIFADEICSRFNLSGRRLLSVAGVVPAVMLVLSAIAWINPDLRNTERSLVRYVMQRDEATVPLFYLSKPPFSAEFYSAGQVREITQSELSQAVEVGTPFYLAIPKSEQKIVADILGKQIDELYSNKRYALVRVPSIKGTPPPTSIQGSLQKTEKIVR